MGISDKIKNVFAGISGAIKNVFASNPNSERLRFAKQEENETRVEQSIFLRIINECSEAYTLLKDAVSSFNESVEDKWKLANLAKLQIKLVEMGGEINNVHAENRKIIALTSKLAAKYPNDKAFEKKIRHFITKLEDKTRTMNSVISEFFKSNNLSETATWIRKGESPKRYAGVFMKCSIALKTISAEAVALQESLTKLYALEKKYLSS